jgi:hypothetical protein
MGVGLANVSAGRPLPVVVTPARLGSLLALTLGMCAGSAISAMVVVTRVDPVTVSPDSFCGGLSCFWDYGSGGTGQGGWIRLGSGESVPSSRLLSALIRDHCMRP